MFYILIFGSLPIFGLLAVVLVVAFVKKWRTRNEWPDDE